MSNESNEKLCPLISINADFPEFTKCQEKDCGFWSGKAGKCSFRALADSQIKI